MEPPRYRVFATWDEDAKVWVATSDDVPGLATEAGTVEDLIKKLQVMVPELLAANATEPPLMDAFPFSIDIPVLAYRTR